MALRGNSSTTITRFGILNFANRPSSAFSTEASLTSAPLLQTTTAVTPSPKSACDKGAEVSEASVLKALDGRLAKFKMPKRVFVVDELPRNAMGKVQKNILRD